MAIAVSLAAFPIQSASTAGASAEGEALTIGTMTGLRSMDPVDAGGGTIPYYQAVYDTLIRRQPDGEFTPMLATEWSYDDTLTTLTLTLRDDVTFDDGSPLDAAAVKANLDRFKEKGSAEAAQAAPTESVEVIDETTVAIHLATPNPALLLGLSDAYGFVANPANFGEDTPFATVPDGTGPYDLDESATIVGSQWVFVRDPDYWGEPLPFETVTIWLFDNENAIVNGLKTNQIDAAVIQSVDQQLAAEADANLTGVFQEVDLKIWTLFDRTGSMVPALGDVRVRQAINYALDRDVLVEAIQLGRGTATSQIWGVDAPGYVPELDTYYGYDPEQATALLAEAGFADGFDLTLGRLPALVPDSLAAAMQTDLGAVGINLTWEDLDQGAWISATFGDHRFPGVVMNGGQPSIDAATIAGSILPNPVSNPFGDTDPTIDELSAAVVTSEGEDAVAAAQDLNRYIVEQAWFVPLFRMEYMHTTNSSVTVLPQSGLAVPAIYNYAPAG